ncbi:M91 family zinc metallopeptidase [Mangrovicoccus algicola]|uniref:NleD-like pathogen effector protein (Putative zinc metallopeptidase) n=1 Tax=Mangrovicoccus algicola TaxID=2771008 RepID=A0A8J6ZAL7_9RHOB|nr:M91 family zinc metallopeptidase [Mangrovicoccus algicola]MBE3639455.1 hypothetical protein [Mangrovicoccus algicola]
MQDHATNWPGVIIRCMANELYFPMITREALARIDSRRLGRSLMGSIARRAHRARFGYTVCIQKPSGNHGSLQGEEIVNGWANIAIRVSEADACNPAAGSPTAIKWNPNLIMGDGGERPPFIALAHELVHAMNNLRGTAFADNRIEEMKTVGLGEHAHDRKRNENTIRAEHGLGARDRYTGLYEP